jgi:hypothetical protein
VHEALARRQRADPRFQRVGPHGVAQDHHVGAGVEVELAGYEPAQKGEAGGEREPIPPGHPETGLEAQEAGEEVQLGGAAGAPGVPNRHAAVPAVEAPERHRAALLEPCGQRCRVAHSFGAPLEQHLPGPSAAGWPNAVARADAHTHLEAGASNHRVRRQRLGKDGEGRRPRLG